MKISTSNTPGEAPSPVQDLSETPLFPELLPVPAPDIAYTPAEVSALLESLQEKTEQQQGRIQAGQSNDMHKWLNAAQLEWLASEGKRGVKNDNAYLYRVGGQEETGIPAHYFAVSQQALEALRFQSSMNEGCLYLRQILECFAAADDRSVGRFSEYAISDFNRLYYGCPDSFDRRLAPAPLFAVDKMICRAFGRFLADECLGEELRVLELAAGPSVERWRWVEAVIDACAPVKVLLTDFAARNLPRDADLFTTPRIRFEKAILDLNSPQAPELGRHDVVLSTYCFDSVWLEGDLRYEKIGDRWFKAKYRMNAPDGTAIEPLRRALQESPENAELRVRDMEQVLIETAFEEVNIECEPWGALLAENCRSKRHARLSVPGGLVKTIQRLFQDTIAAEGCLLIGDVGSFEPGGAGYQTAWDFAKTGRYAKYHPLDFHLLKVMLESSGYGVEITRVPAFCARYITDAEAHFKLWYSDRAVQQDTYIAVVRRHNKSGEFR